MVQILAPSISLFGSSINGHSFDQCVGDSVVLQYDMDVQGDLSHGVKIEVGGSAFFNKFLSQPRCDPFILIGPKGDFMPAPVFLKPSDNSDDLVAMVSHADFSRMADLGKLRALFGFTAKAETSGAGNVRVAIHSIAQPKSGFERDAAVSVHGVESAPMVKRQKLIGFNAEYIAIGRSVNFDKLSGKGISKEEVEQKAHWLQASKWLVRESGLV